MHESTINNQKVNDWLNTHNITLGENFATALRRMSLRYKNENGIPRLDDVYHKIGTRKENIYYWLNHPENTQTKKFQI